VEQGWISAAGHLALEIELALAERCGKSEPTQEHLRTMQGMQELRRGAMLHLKLSGSLDPEGSQSMPATKRPVTKSIHHGGIGALADQRPDLGAAASSLQQGSPKRDAESSGSEPGENLGAPLMDLSGGC